MRKILSGAGALALAIALAACGGAPTTPESSGGLPAIDPTTPATDIGGTAGQAYPGTSATSASGDTDTGSSAGTSATTTAPGTSATSASSDTDTGSSAGTSATSTSGDSVATGESIVTTLAADPRFSTLTTLLEDTGLATQLAAAGPVTLFAPTNEAFEALPAGTLDTLSQDPATLEQILLFHVAPGALRSTDIGSGATAPTLAGEELEISAMGSEVMVNEAMVVEPDIAAGSSVVHAIDQVLLPASVALEPGTGS